MITKNCILMQLLQTRTHNCWCLFKSLMKKKVLLPKSFVLQFVEHIEVELKGEKKDHSSLWNILVFRKLFSLWLRSKSSNAHIYLGIVWGFGSRNIHLSACPAAPGRPGTRGHGTQQVLYWRATEMSWQDTKKSFKACLVADFQWDFITIGLF